jgi:ATP-dependent RNA helicase RhlE
MKRLIKIKDCNIDSILNPLIKDKISFSWSQTNTTSVIDVPCKNLQYSILDNLTRKEVFFAHSKIKSDLKKCNVIIDEVPQQNINYYSLTSRTGNNFKLNNIFCIDIKSAYPTALKNEKLISKETFDDLQKLVIDEFDEILNLGFRTQVTSLLTMMKNKRQNILFSATMTDEVDAMLDEYFELPEEVSLAASGTPLEKIEQLGYYAPNFLTKLNLLNHLLDTDESTSRVLIFANNKKTVDLIANSIEESHPEQFGVIHSNKSQNYRLQTMASFQEGNLRGIITTDIMARGLDISDITHVVNFEMPEFPELYMHRIGRTGRADASGTAISFITPREGDLITEVEILMNHEIEVIEFPEEVEISTKLIEPEKDKQPIKFLLKKPKLDGNGAFHEKSKKNKKVNLGGPSKTKKKVSGSVNRNMLKTRDKKRKEKIKNKQS